LERSTIVCFELLTSEVLDTAYVARMTRVLVIGASHVRSDVT
jgi:hypothetical protein